MGERERVGIVGHCILYIRTVTEKDRYLIQIYYS